MFDRTGRHDMQTSGKTVADGMRYSKGEYMIKNAGGK
jgi:hypothetical protein